MYSAGREHGKATRWYWLVCAGWTISSECRSHSRWLCEINRTKGMIYYFRPFSNRFKFKTRLWTYFLVLKTFRWFYQNFFSPFCRLWKWIHAHLGLSVPTFNRVQSAVSDLVCSDVGVGHQWCWSWVLVMLSMMSVVVVMSLVVWKLPLKAEFRRVRAAADDRQSKSVQPFPLSPWMNSFTNGGGDNGCTRLEVERIKVKNGLPFNFGYSHNAASLSVMLWFRFGGTHANRQSDDYDDSMRTWRFWLRRDDVHTGDKTMCVCPDTIGKRSRKERIAKRQRLTIFIRQRSPADSFVFIRCCARDDDARLQLISTHTQKDCLKRFRCPWTHTHRSGCNHLSKGLITFCGQPREEARTFRGQMEEFLASRKTFGSSAFCLHIKVFESKKVSSVSNTCKTPSSPALLSSRFLLFLIRLHSTMRVFVQFYAHCALEKTFKV